MPYAAKATIEHKFITDYLEIYVTFNRPMKLSSSPLDSPPPFDILPDITRWLLDVDSVSVNIVTQEWLDLWTLLLTSDTIATSPTLVKLEYDGPDENLRTSWNKQWEAFGPIVSTDLTAELLPTGLIMLWHGSTATIPTGWTLCNGSNGTPDLRDKFIVGAGNTYAVNATGGTTQHNHNYSFSLAGGLNFGTKFIDSTPNGAYNSTFSGGGGGVTDSKNHLPPYYALCYIMKL